MLFRSLRFSPVLGPPTTLIPHFCPTAEILPGQRDLAPRSGKKSRGFDPRREYPANARLPLFPSGLLWARKAHVRLPSRGQSSVLFSLARMTSNLAASVSDPSSAAVRLQGKGSRGPDDRNSGPVNVRVDTCVDHAG